MPRNSKHAYESTAPIFSPKSTYMRELNMDSKFISELMNAIITPSRIKQATGNQIPILINSCLCLEKGPYQAIGGGKTNRKTPVKVKPIETG